VRPYYAHSLPGQPQDKWEPLYTGDGTGHLEKVAALAEKFAAKFGAAEWGRVAGLWHDLGKFSQAFQNMVLGSGGFDAHLETQTGRVDHSSAVVYHAFMTMQVLQAVELPFSRGTWPRLRVPNRGLLHDMLISERK
jgi:hypothetical protein